jgi:two-component SAPR family response regulator
MPGLQGHEPAAAVQRILPDTKIILMSGYAEALAGEDLEPRLRLVDRPFTRATLLDAIHAAERS